MKINLNVKIKTPYNRNKYRNYRINITKYNNTDLRNILKAYFKYSELKEQYPREWYLEVDGKEIPNNIEALLKGFQLRIVKILKEESIPNKYVEEETEYYKNIENTIRLIPTSGFEDLDEDPSSDFWTKCLDINYLQLYGNNAYKLNNTDSQIYLRLKVDNIWKTGYYYYTFNITNVTTEDLDNIIKKFCRINVQAPYSINIWMLNVIAYSGDLSAKSDLIEYTKVEIQKFLEKYGVENSFEYGWTKTNGNEDDNYAFELDEYKNFNLPSAEVLIRDRYKTNL